MSPWSPVGNLGQTVITVRESLPNYRILEKFIEQLQWLWYQYGYGNLTIFDAFS